MNYKKVVVAGGGVLGSQIAFQTAYCGFDVTIWLRSEGSIKRCLPKLETLKENYELIHTLINARKVLSVSSIKGHGIAEIITKSTIGNKIGFEFTNKNINVFNPMYGSFIIEVDENVTIEKAEELGRTIEDKKIIIDLKSSKERTYNYMLVNSNGLAYKVDLNNEIEQFGNISDDSTWDNILKNLS